MSDPSALLTSVSAGAAGAASLPELAARTLGPLRQLTGAAHALLYAYGPDGMFALGGDAWIPETYRPYWAQDPTQAETKRLAPGPKLALADRLVDSKRLRSSRAYVEFYAPCEIEHLCCVFLNDKAHGAPGMTNLFLARGPKQEPYQRETVAALERALPIMSAAVSRLQRMPSGVADRGEDVLLEWGRQQACVATSLEGRIDWISPAAHALLGPDAPSSLPPQVLARLRRLQPCAREHTALVTSWVHWRLADGRLLRIDFSLTPSLDRFGRALLLLSEVQPKASTLSPAETHVMECLGAGHSTGEIATVLSLSEATVRTHLRNVYKKLRVRSRTEAVLEWQTRRGAD